MLRLFLSVRAMLIVTLLGVISTTGCIRGRVSDSAQGSGPGVLTKLSEPDWVRNGESIQFEGEDWYPTDEIESLLSGELYQAGTFKGLPFYLEKSDVRPFARIYTFFLRNRYRAYEKRE